jgi:NAD-dependent dihydropyrimidine dehydrogenase PreA subunit
MGVVAAMNVRELPHLNEQRCTGSGECIAVCPTDCLEWRSALPVLAWPHQCIGCGLCEAVCPVQAIRLESQWCA